MTILINTVEAKEQFPEIINRVAQNKERIILTRRGKEIAAIVHIDDFKLIMASHAKNDLNEAAEALKEARKMGTMSLEQLKEEMSI